MDLTPEKVREILKIAQEPVSLETPIGEEDDSHLVISLKTQRHNLHQIMRHMSS